ncbi:hypothetical protein DPEC_G00355000 [Dallia pectoralis]|uniref:Uncharacterized protein n=1 Tax=Dallia pectoralis TaxID=75939 RepID=A0ACC2EZB8_DALPE|nr:hypothetical protein DPEC_G00355000 [Dallia pectoralis]
MLGRLLLQTWLVLWLVHLAHLKNYGYRQALAAAQPNEHGPQHNGNGGDVRRMLMPLGRYRIKGATKGNELVLAKVLVSLLELDKVLVSLLELDKVLVSLLELEKVLVSLLELDKKGPSQVMLVYQMDIAQDKMVMDLPVGD